MFLVCGPYFWAVQVSQFDLTFFTHGLGAKISSTD